MQAEWKGLQPKLRCLRAEAEATKRDEIAAPVLRAMEDRAPTPVDGLLAPTVHRMDAALRPLDV